MLLGESFVHGFADSPVAIFRRPLSGAVRVPPAANEFLELLSLLTRMALPAAAVAAVPGLLVTEVEQQVVAPVALPAALAAVPGVLAQ